MTLPRALITLALCLSAFAANAPTPSMLHFLGVESKGIHRGGEHRPTPSYRPSPHRRRAQALNSLAPAEIAAEICPDDLYGCPSQSRLPSSLPKTCLTGYPEDTNASTLKPI
ncbi:hypothetical protein BJ912DRAFT_1052765 [Pholiota molesta]|nr:hypothetical protein BJ912DRAFT_1052765 [Pholiota molesta]